MAQLSGDSFAGGQAVLSLDDAVRLLFERIPAIADIDTVALGEADGRIFAAPLMAPFDLPDRVGFLAYASLR